jgi:hypothetical protein
MDETRTTGLSPVTLIRALVAVCFIALLVVGTAHRARGFPPFLTQAQKLGFPARDCAYCHVSARGGDMHNERGKWLVTEKEKRKANVIDVAWLKEYEASRKPKAGARGKKKP